MLSIIKLKYFKDVVDLCSFTKAASKNHVAQTSISQQIKELEATYDVKLIDRNTIPISVTEAGRLLYLWSEIILKDIDRLNEEMEQQKEQRLKIAYTSLQDLSYLNTLFSYMPLYQKKVSVAKELMINLTPYLRNEKIDIAITFDSEFVDEPDIETIPLSNGHYKIGIRKDHPLAIKSEVTMDEIYQYPSVMITPTSIGKSYDLMIKRSQKAGEKPNIGEIVDNVESELFMIQQKNLIGFFPEDFPMKLENPNLKLIKIKNSPHSYQRVIAYKKNASSKIISLTNEIKNIVAYRFNL